MSEAVEILITADDQASEALEALGDNAEKAGARAGNAFMEMGGRAKATTGLVAVLATISGQPEIANLSRQIGGVTEKLGAMSSAAKVAGASAMGLKLGLVGLVATLGVMAGKALGDIIFQTEKSERSLQRAKAEASDLDDELKKFQATLIANRREDIELIRNPEEKRAAYRKLFDELNRDIGTAWDKVKQSQRDVEYWADAWKITGNDKAMAEEAGRQLEQDKDRLNVLKAQSEQIQRLLSARAKQNELLKAENAAKDKSESYIAHLRQEVEYLQATREEQIKLDAARNTVPEDRRMAERLLEERDAIREKIEAEKELAEVQKKAQEDQARAAEKAKEEAEREEQRIEDIIQAEEERLDLQRIELEQGKEAARVQDLINRGVDEATAQRLAEDQAELERLKEQQEKPQVKSSSSPSAILSAVEGRLLTRGRADPMQEQLAELNKSIRDMSKAVHEQVGLVQNGNEQLELLVDNTSDTMQMVAVA